MNTNITNNKFLAEIYEQPAALKETLDFYVDGEGKDNLLEAMRCLKESKSASVIFTGMGSSFFISNIASQILSSYGIAAQAINAGELIHYQLPAITPDTLLICISQSGESFEIKKILEKLPLGVSCIGICNEADSTLARQSRILLLSKAGKEYMTSTKTFTSTAMVAIILSLALAGGWTTDRISRSGMIIKAVEHLISNHSAWLPRVMEVLRNAGFIQLLGRGPSMAAVQQGALMFMEGARIPASALYSGEFRHGPMEMVKKGFLAIILAPDGETHSQHLKLADDIIHFGGKVILLSNIEPETSSKVVFIHTPCSDESFFSIPAIIPLQFMVNQFAIEKGSIPGEFIRGAKVTTNE